MAATRFPLSSWGRAAPVLSQNPPPSPPLPQLLNLILAAGMTQQWYHKKFSSYPKARRALIPWVY